MSNKTKGKTAQGDAAFKYTLQRKEVRLWLSELRGRGCLHPSRLVDSWEDADPVARVRDLMEKLEDAGWIIRGKFEPTKSSRAFDLNASLKCNPQFHLDSYAWMPNYESQPFYDYLHGEK